MKIRRRERDGIHILELTGDFIVGSPRLGSRGSAGTDETSLKETIDDLLAGGGSRILIDLERIGSFDSGTLAELVSCKKRTMQAGGDTKLLRPSGRVRDLLDITRLRDVFDIHDDEDTAVTSF